MNVADRIRAVADPLIERGYDDVQVRQAVFSALGIGIGGGGGGTTAGVLYPGPQGEVANCPYCGANGGGGHGGMCPSITAGS